MDDIRMDVAEQQLDKLAGRLAEVERMLEELVKTLAAPAIAARIGLTKDHVYDIGRTLLSAVSATLTRECA